MILDIVIIALIVIVAFAGFIKGFTKVFFNWATLAGVLAGMVFLAPMLASLLSETGMGTSLISYFEGKFPAKIPQLTVLGTEGALGSLIAYVVLTGACAIVIGIVIYIVILVLKKLVNMLFRKIKLVDRILGIFMSVAVFAVFALLVTGILSIGENVGSLSFIFDMVNESTVFKFIYDINPLKGLIKF